MARASLYLDMRAVKEGQPGPLKVRYHHKGKTIFLPTTIQLLPNQWMGDTIINHPKAKLWNSMLQLRRADVTSEIRELEIMGTLGTMTAEQLKAKLMEKLGHVIRLSRLSMPIELCVKRG